MCHTIRGTDAGSRVGPDLTHLASRGTIAAGTLKNTTGNLAGWIMNSQSIKPGNHMPSMSLQPDDLQALLAYLGSCNEKVTGSVLCQAMPCPFCHSEAALLAAEEPVHFASFF